MGARFSSDVLPLEVRGADLGGIAIKTAKASAQVKSAILLAGLNAFGDIHVSEPTQSRNHTELMLTSMGCPVTETALAAGRWGVTISQDQKPEFLSPLEIEVPGDFSSAAFLVVAALLIPSSEILIKNVCFNPTRIGLYDLLVRMGANIEVQNSRVKSGERVVDLLVKHSELKGISVSADEVVRAIDEIPILSVAAAFADGDTEIVGAGELRVKESDRISMIVDLLSTYSVAVEEREDGVLISGANGQLSLAQDAASHWKTSGDHRIAMSAAVLGLAFDGQIALEQESVVETSFPGFVDKIQALSS
jgi:3-phosphoshikimate 1-carboxyvinyltransferase